MTDPIMPTTTLSDFSVDNQSLTLEVLNVQVKCDLVTLDIGLNDSYIKLLEEGKKLTLNYNTFISQYQTVGGQTYVSINISKSLTRLKICIIYTVEGLPRCTKDRIYRWKELE